MHLLTRECAKRMNTVEMEKKLVVLNCYDLPEKGLHAELRCLKLQCLSTRDEKHVTIEPKDVQYFYCVSS